MKISWSNPWGADLGCGLCSCKSLGHGIEDYIQKCLDITYKRPSSIPSCAHEIPLHFPQIPLKKMGYLRCDSRGIYITILIHRAGTHEKNYLNGVTNFLRGVTLFSIQYFINLIGTCLKKLWDPLYKRVGMRYPTLHYPILVFY